MAELIILFGEIVIRVQKQVFLAVDDGEESVILFSTQAGIHMEKNSPSLEPTIYSFNSITQESFSPPYPFPYSCRPKSTFRWTVMSQTT